MLFREAFQSTEMLFEWYSHFHRQNTTHTLNFSYPFKGINSIWFLHFLKEFFPERIGMYFFLICFIFRQTRKGNYCFPLVFRHSLACWYLLLIGFWLSECKFLQGLSNLATFLGYFFLVSVWSWMMSELKEWGIFPVGTEVWWPVCSPPFFSQFAFLSLFPPPPPAAFSL